MKRIWFLNTLVHVRVGTSNGQDGLSVLEHRVPLGDSPPLHIHHTEDEVFHIVEGEFRIRVGYDTQRYGPGSFLLAPKGIPHTYRAESPSGGRFVTVTARGDFEKFVRALGREAERDELPPPAGSPGPDAIKQLGSLARPYGIELVGAPLD
jgi:quercetin dioxygenase-like cupin family protein